MGVGAGLRARGRLSYEAVGQGRQPVSWTWAIGVLRPGAGRVGRPRAPGDRKVVAVGQGMLLRFCPRAG